MEIVAPLIPVGFSLAPDPDTRVGPAGATVWGGTPWRLLRLSAAGADLAGALLGGQPVTDAAGGALARRLVESGLAAPVPPAGVEPAEIEVVVPARDRPGALGRCLTALTGLPVTVVDDASVHPGPVAAVAAAHGARLIRLGSNRGPGATRNV